MFKRIMQAFRPLDTSAVDAAIAEAAQANHDVRVRARALRMDVSCGDATTAIQRFTSRLADGAGAILAQVYPPHPAIPADMKDLLGKL